MEKEWIDISLTSYTYYRFRRTGADPVIARRVLYYMDGKCGWGYIENAVGFIMFIDAAPLKDGNCAFEFFSMNANV